MAETEKKNTKSGLSAKKKDELINIILRKDNTENVLKTQIESLKLENKNIKDDCENIKTHNKDLNEKLISLTNKNKNIITEKQKLEEKLAFVNKEAEIINKTNRDLTDRISNRNIALIILSIALIIAIIF